MNIGEVFQERYRIIDILGQGGMGKVYLAENTKLGSLRAIKEIAKDSTFANIEPEILKKLQHPALPGIVDIFDDDRNIYMVEEYISGKSLERKLVEEGRFPEAVVLEWANQLCDVLAYLHSQKPHPIIYRDMKPSNIIHTDNGLLKLIDFGIAREYKEKAVSDTVYIGTRGYAAPEQYGSGQTNASTDIYSLGVTLYQLLTGVSPDEPPYEIKPVRYFDTELSEDIEKILRKCTKQNPAERYQSVTELKSELDMLGCRAGGAGCAEIKGSLSGHGSLSAHPFRKLVITVWDNAEFGCELAYMAAHMSGLTVFLADMDLLAPKADIFLKLKKYPPRIISEGKSGKTGLNIIIDSLEKNYFTPGLLLEASIKRKELDNLFILTGSYKLEDYEYFNDSSAIRLIENAYLNFDLTILLVNRSIYDSFSVCALIKSDYNFLPIRADLDKIREFNSYIAFLSEKQNIQMGKTKYIAFEYEKATGVDLLTMAEATGNNLAGCISYSAKRAAFRNLRGIYAKSMGNQNVAEYKELLTFLNIIPEPGLVERIIYRLRLRTKNRAENRAEELIWKYGN